MKWIGLRAKNAGQIRCTQEKSKDGRLFIELKPNTVIHALNVITIRVMKIFGIKSMLDRRPWNLIVRF